MQRGGLTFQGPGNRGVRWIHNQEYLHKRNSIRPNVELDRGNILAALACLERALAIWDDPLWHSRLGFCIAKERGHLTRAFELCRSSIEHDPKNPIHYLYLGKVHQIAANQYEALQALRQGMTLGGTPEIEQVLDSHGRSKTSGHTCPLTAQPAEQIPWKDSGPPGAEIGIR